ncbi:hypothetical protein EYR40_006618 [Pleurotus pulmonarius]|nr:hypothetical protein EYR36_011239 [Pleurotus pulmonarius]KAF4599524.1 hypothetical protein EYR40_006618 [Pleurotus pulmonarius]
MDHPVASSQLTDSLVKRLAGPSTGKAGLAKDQTEINRIIAEASKGSKFYENEKKKDKDLTERIARILKLRDEAIEGVDLAKIEHHVDKLIVDLESERDLSQVIVHFDMDAFFANVELLHDPTLKGKPFSVGGGVISTASYEARKYGVRSGMPSFIAKKLCPELILLRSHYEWYNEESNKVFTILRRYDPRLSAAGCDEGYLNITPYLRKHNLAPDECVEEIRRTVHAETSLTVSAGIAPNMNKPNGQFHLAFDSKTIVEFMGDLSIRKVPGIGRVNERLLESVGVKTCGDVYTHRAVLYLMDKQFGLRFLLRTYLGIASNEVKPYERNERKSIGAERTFSPLSSTKDMLDKLEEVAAELESDMESSGWTGRTVTLKFKLDTFQVFTRAKSLNHWVNKKEELFAVGKELLFPELPISIRLIGLRVTKLKDLKASTSEGIKRFFGPAQQAASGGKRKASDVDDDDEDASIDQEEQENDDDVMPGFHEQDEADIDPSQHDVDDDEGLQIIPPPANTRKRPPNSVPDKSISHPPTLRSRSKSAGPSRSHGAAIAGPSATSSTPSETHTCPVCNEVLSTNNTGLNEHIDYCLSRDAIQQAQGTSTKVNKTLSSGDTTKEYAMNGLKRLKLRPDAPAKSKRKG